MHRYLFFLGVLAGGLLVPVRGRAQPADGTVLRGGRTTDADLARIAAPEKLEVIRLRGQMGYGADSVTDAGIARLTACKNLRVLSAGGLGLTDRSLEAIGQLTALEELNLDSNRITGSGLRHLGKLTKLRRLNLDFNPIRPDTLAALPLLPGLTHLLLRATFRADDGVLEICSKLSNLEELQLPEVTNAVTDRGVGSLAKLKKLRNVSLNGSKEITDAGLAQLAKLEHLQEFILRELPSVTPRGVEVVGKLPELRRLDITSVAMDNGSVRAIGSLKKLENLMLWSVTNEPLALDPLGQLSLLRYFRTNERVFSSAIRALGKLEHLESIGDELTEITDEDLTYLARAPKLRSLILGSEHITAASLPTLAKMKSLRELYVTEKVQVNAEQWTLLGQSALTQCRISRYRPPYTVYYQPANWGQ